MPPIRLYSGPLSMFGMKAEIAAREKGLDFELVMVPFENSVGYSPKHPEVLRINPKGQVPVLVHGDVELFDSTQIFEYFEDLQPSPPLWPAVVAERARARLLEHQSDEVYFPYVVRLMGLQAKLDDPAALAAVASVNDYYAQMDRLLDGRAYLAGPFGYADITFFMASLFGDRMGAPITDATPRLLAWRERMSARPAVRQVAGTMARYLAATNRPVPVWLQAIGAA